MKIMVLALAGLMAAASAQAGTIAADNKAVAARVFNDIYNRHDFAAAQEIYAPGFVNHGEARDIGIAEDQAATHGWVAAFPDLHVTIDKQIAEGDFVTVLWTGEGTNTGNGNGFNATGAHLKMRGITIWRVVDGKLIEEWSEFNERAAAERATKK
jgi:predicted ester cyclase